MPCPTNDEFWDDVMRMVRREPKLLTIEEAEKALDEVGDCPPLSEERIEEIMGFVREQEAKQGKCIDLVEK